MRYQVTIRKGKKTVQHAGFDDYDTAMAWLDSMEDKYGEQYTADFRDTKNWK